MQFNDKALSGGTTIALVGTTSSGKSTIGNLLCGHFILPVDAQETTTRAIKLRHSPHLTKAMMTQEKSNVIVHSDMGIRDCLAEKMAQPVNEQPPIRVDIPIGVGRPCLLSSLGIRSFISYCRGGAAPRLQYPHGPLTIIDLPGYKYVNDNKTLDHILNGCSNAIPLLIFNAEETDTSKEDALVKALLSTCREGGKSSSSVLYVLNRVDCFHRDQNAEKALATTRLRVQLLRLRLAGLHKEVFGKNEKSEVELLPLAAMPAFTGELLARGTGELSNGDRDWLFTQASSFVRLVRHGYGMNNMPLSAEQWSWLQVRKYIQHIRHVSGYEDLLRSMGRRLQETVNLYRI